jgi:hypothetical protein
MFPLAVLFICRSVNILVKLNYIPICEEPQFFFFATITLRTANGELAE